MYPIRQHLFRTLPLLLAALAAAASARAAESYLKIVPSTALGWGAVNHMDDANEKLRKLATTIQAPSNNLLIEIKNELGLSKGIDEKGAAGIFGVAGKTEKDASVGAFFVAVANEKDFLGNFEIVKAGEKISEVKTKTGKKSIHCLAFRGGYAVISPTSDRAAVEAALEAKQDISAEMAGLEPWLAENDAFFIGTAAGIKYAAKQGGEELKKAKPNSGNGPDAAVARSVLDLYGKALAAAPSEISLAAVGFLADKQGSIHIAGRARLVNGGLVSKTVAMIPPPKGKLLSGVPGGPFVFSFAGTGIPSAADSYIDLATGVLNSIKRWNGMSAEDVESLNKESFEILRQVRAMEFVMKTGKRGDPIFGNIYCVMTVDNSQQVLDLQEKYVEHTNKRLQNAKQSVLKSTTAKRLEIAGKPALQEEASFDLSNIRGAEADHAVAAEMLGVGGKMVGYVVAADEHTVLVGLGVSQERMAAALDVLKQPKKSLAEDTALSLTAAMFPAGSQWVAYVSPRGFVQLMLRLVAATTKNEMEAMGVSLPQFPPCAPIGFAVKAMPDELHAEIVVPSSFIEAAAHYVQDVQKMFMERAGQPNPGPAP
jgi:hypothetical protein